jgi:hypothetical protein
MTMATPRRNSATPEVGKAGTQWLVDGAPSCSFPSSSCLYADRAQAEALSRSSMPYSLRCADDDEEQGRPGCRSGSSATLRGFGGGGDEVTAGLLCALLGAWAGWPSTRELHHLLELVA